MSVTCPSPRERPHVHSIRRALAASLVAAALTFLAATSPAHAQVRGPVTIRQGAQEATILADQIQQVGGPRDLLIAVGNVEITQGQSRLLADRVEVNRDTGEAIAQGRVVFFDGQDRLVGDRVDYNLKTGTGVVYNASAFSEPYYRISGERMDRLGPGLYSIRRGVFTTCEGDEPAWSFKIGSGTMNLDDIIYGQSASLWIADKLPLIPWVPFFAAALRRERQSGFLFPEYGNSSKKGFFAKLPYYWAISDSQDLTVSLDVFTRRGVGVEGEYRYILSQDARGSFYGFFIPEFLRDGQDRERLDIPKNRGFYTLKHDWTINPRLSFKVDSTLTTDDLVFREYGDRLQDRSRQRAETNVFLSQRWDNWSLVANVLWYQDLTTPTAVELQRVPEVKLQGLRQPVPYLPNLLYETEASFTNFLREVGDGGVRADFHPRLYLPIPVAGLFTVTPFLGGRATYYNQRRVGERVVDSLTVEDTIHEDRVRLQVEAGIEAETRASRIFQLDGKGGVAALQHVIEPRVQYLQIGGINQKDTPQYDGVTDQRQASAGLFPIDKIGRVNQLTYSLINRVNAKTVSGPDQEPVRWEMLRFALTQTLNIRRAISQSQPFEDLIGDVIFRPTSFLQFRADSAYNMYGLGFRSANTDITATYRDVSASVGYRFDDIAGANFITTQLSARILANLDGHIAMNYDIHEGASVENRLGFDWRFQCFTISAEYVNRNKNENEFHLSVNLLGVGQTGTKMGLGR